MRVRVVLLAVLLLPAAPVSAPVSASPCRDVFPASFAEQLARDHPGLRVTASVLDVRTGCRHDLAPGLRLTTASVIKAGVLAAVLLRAQDEGRSLTGWERDRVRPMVQYSHDRPSTTDLYARAGGVAGMDRLDARVGATATRNTASYGATTTTALDRSRLARALLHGGGPFTSASRAEAWRYMSTVHPTQRWGISAGVPVGWRTALKNGFYPMRGHGWRVGSTGFVQRDGTGYAVTVLTDRARSQVEGMALVEDVSRRVASVLLGGPPAPRSVDRARCTTTRGDESWRTVAARLGASAADVQRVSGGGRAPLQGQRACAPDV